MTTLHQKILHKILNHKIEGIPKFDHQMHPYYDGFSNANIPASICRWLGCPLPSSRPLDDEILQSLKQSYQHVIFVVVDGLGMEFLQRDLNERQPSPSSDNWKAILRDNLLLPLTSMTPSTTSAALTTFWTGRLPAEHGIIGYELFLKEYGLIANMIKHSVSAFLNESGNLVKAGFDPKTFLPVETLGKHFDTHGVQAYALQHETIADSGLSQMFLNGTQAHPYQTLPEMWQDAWNIQQENADSKSYTYIYWGELDTLAHHAGPQNEELIQQWQVFTKHLAEFILRFGTQRDHRTLLVLTADHGQIPTEILPDYDLQNHPDFMQHLLMNPSGESRLPYLFIKPGHEEALREYLGSRWEGQFSMLPSSEVLASGLLGKCQPYQGTIDRMGQYVVFPKNNAYWWWVKKENQLLGRHGGLSQSEMLVPFLALEL